MKKSIFTLLFAIYSQISFCQFYFGADYAPGLAISEQFGANYGPETQALFTPNQSAAFIVGKKMKKNPFRLESGLRFTSHYIAAKYDDVILANKFPKDILEKFTVIEIPLAIKFDFAKRNHHKSKDAGISKWQYSGLFGISYVSVVQSTAQIDGTVSSYEKDFLYKIDGNDFLRQYRYGGGLIYTEPPALVLNYGFSINYKLRKKSSINFTLGHSVGFVPIAGVTSFVRTYRLPETGFASTLVTLTSNANNLNARFGYFYNF